MTDLSSYIPQFKNKKVLVIGDVMLDEYIHGSAERISPEAPIPVLLQKSIKHVLGGAGNVAANAAALGANVSLVGIVGADARAKLLAKLALGYGISPHFVADKTRPTTTKTRFVSSHHQLARIDVEETGALSKKTESAVIKMIGNFEKQDVVIISDYAKGLVTDRVVAALRKKFGTRSIIADMKPVNARFYRGILAVTPNLKETFDMTGIRAVTDADATHAAKMVAKQLKTCVVLTRGEHGITVCGVGNSCRHFRSTVMTVKDVTGAGDTLIAVMALMIASGASLLKASEAANFAAGVVVGIAGTHALKGKELEEHLTREMESAR